MSCLTWVSWWHYSRLECQRPLFRLGAYPTIETYSIFVIWSADGATPPIPSSFPMARSP